MLGVDIIQLIILSQSSFTQVIMHPIVPDPLKLIYNESYLNKSQLEFETSKMAKLCQEIMFINVSDYNLISNYVQSSLRITGAPGRSC